MQRRLSPKQYCPEKDRLLQIFTTYSDVQFEVSTRIAVLAANGRSTDFQAALSEGRLATANCRQARLAFNKHRSEHGC